MPITPLNRINWFYFSRNGSPARGVIWVENNGPDVFQSPVGTRCGYFEGKNTHIPSLTGLRKHRESPFATHISPLTGLLAMLKPEPIEPAWKGNPAYVRSIVDTGLYTLSASECPSKSQSRQ